MPRQGYNYALRDRALVDRAEEWLLADSIVAATIVRTPSTSIMSALHTFEKKRKLRLREMQRSQGQPSG
jgi:hypothetical protein